MPTRKHNNTFFGAYYFIFRGHSVREPVSIMWNEDQGTQYGNLYQSCGTKTRVTFFILLAHTATGVSHSHHKNSKEVWKNADEWTVRVEISSRKKSLAVMKYALLYSDLIEALKGEHLSYRFLTDGSLISASSVPHSGSGTTSRVTRVILWILTVVCLGHSEHKKSRERFWRKQR